MPQQPETVDDGSGAAAQSAISSINQSLDELFKELADVK
jgi:hypothetical protein